MGQMPGIVCLAISIGYCFKIAAEAALATEAEVPLRGLLDHKSLRLEGALDAEVFSALMAVERERRFGDGEMIFSQGDAASDMLLIHEGGVRIGRTTTDGREMTLAVLGPGHHVGMVGMMVGRRGQGALANGETRVGLISKADFDRVLQNHPRLAAQLLPVILSRLRAALNFIDDIKRLPVSVHTAVILEQLLDASEDAHVIDWSQTDIALAVGSSRVSVGKALKELERQGLIKLSYARVKVPDAQRLSDWVSQHRAQLLPLE